MSKKVAALQTTEETPQVASVTLASDFDGYLFAITMDGSWSDTLCSLVHPPAALARRRAKTTPMSQGLSAFFMIDSRSADTGCPHDWCSNIPLRRTNEAAALPGPVRTKAPWREGCALHHCEVQAQRALPDRVCEPSDPSSLEARGQRHDGAVETPRERRTGPGLDWRQSLVGALGPQTVRSR